MSNWIVFVSVLLISNVSFAARQWVQDVSIKDVYVYSDVLSGTTYNKIRISFNEPVSTGCAVSDAGNYVTYWIAGDFNSAMASWISLALSAQAQNKKVDIMIDTASSSCSSAYGRKFYGLVVHGNQ